MFSYLSWLLSNEIFLLFLPTSYEIFQIPCSHLENSDITRKACHPRYCPVITHATKCVCHEIRLHMVPEKTGIDFFICNNLAGCYLATSESCDRYFAAQKPYFSSLIGHLTILWDSIEWSQVRLYNCKVSHQPRTRGQTTSYDSYLRSISVHWHNIFFCALKKSGRYTPPGRHKLYYAPCKG
jgi:hypothetical protein